MGILDRLFPRRQTSSSLQARKVGGIRPVSETPGVLWPRATSAGTYVDEMEALTLSAVFAACVRLANIVASLPIGVYKKDGGKREEQLDNPASRILAVEANPVQTAFQARFFMAFWKPLFGAAVAEIGWDGAGRARYLWPLEPWRVYPAYDDDGKLIYKVDGTRTVQPEDLVYVPHVTEDGVCGKGFVHYALESLGSAIAADRSAGRFFDNDMRPGGLLVHDGNPTKEARGELREDWKRNHGGVKNRGSVGILWGGWKWVKESGAIEPDKAQLLESRKWTVLEVARWLNVPPHWLAELGRATWANIESESIEALKYSVGPLLIAQEQEYDRKLLSPPRLYCKHNVNALLRADMKARAEYFRIMKEIGIYNTNEIRAYEDENGIGPEGDQRFVPVNWQPADDLTTGGEAQRKAAEASKPAVPPEEDKGPEEEDKGPEGEKEEPPADDEQQGAKPEDQPVIAPERQPTSSPALADALRAVAEHALSGLQRKEINEARRAAKKPNDVTKWMDGFYPDFEALMATALLPAALLKLALSQWAPVVSGVEKLSKDEPAFKDDGSASRLAEQWARDWVEESRGDLFTAMECKPEEWPKRCATLLESWEGRAEEVAAKIAGERHSDRFARCR